MKSTLPSLCWSYKIQDKVATVTVLAVLAVMAVSVVTATPFSVTLNKYPENTKKKVHGMPKTPVLVFFLVLLG